MQINRDEVGVLKIAGNLVIDAAEELQTALRDYLQESSALLVDLSEVETCDTAGLQLLCSARKTAERSGRLFELRGPSEAVLHVGAALGLPMTEMTAKRGDEGAI